MRKDAAITVDKVSFGADGVIDLGYGADERRMVGSRTLMTFSELDAAGREAIKSWRFENAGAGKRPVKLRVTEGALVFEVCPIGMTIDIR